MDTKELAALADEMEALAGTKKLEAEKLNPSDAAQQEATMQFLLLARWVKTIREAIKP
jgi:hypothetical protein